jgi:hypothetical protein
MNYSRPRSARDLQPLGPAEKHSSGSRRRLLPWTAMPCAGHANVPAAPGQSAGMIASRNWLSTATDA